MLSIIARPREKEMKSTMCGVVHAMLCRSSCKERLRFHIYRIPTVRSFCIPRYRESVPKRFYETEITLLRTLIVSAWSMIAREGIAREEIYDLSMIQFVVEFKGISILAKYFLEKEDSTFSWKRSTTFYAFVHLTRIHFEKRQSQQKKNMFQRVFSFFETCIYT